jgi:proteasome accessory factor B
MPQRRHVEPWGVVNRHGRWYVAGHDSDRDGVRVFRLSRIDGRVDFSGPPGSVTVPAGADVREVVRDWDSRPPEHRSAVLRIRKGAGYGLRRHATEDSAIQDSAIQGGASRDDAGQDRAEADGWDRVVVPFSGTGWFADHLASFGADVIVVDPPDLREAVIRRLKGALA